MPSADAVRAAAAGTNYVFTTGTGSDKSRSYIVPIVDHVLRAWDCGETRKDPGDRRVSDERSGR